MGVRTQGVPFTVRLGLRLRRTQDWDLGRRPPPPPLRSGGGGAVRIRAVTEGASRVPGWVMWADEGKNGWP